MKKLAQSLVVLAVGGHVGLSVADAYARGMGSHSMSSFHSNFSSSRSGGGAMYTHANPSFGHYSGEYGGNPGGPVGGGDGRGKGGSNNGDGRVVVLNPGNPERGKGAGDGRGKGDAGSQDGDGRVVVINPGNPNRGKGSGDGRCEGDGCGGRQPPAPPRRFHPIFGEPDFAPPLLGDGGGRRRRRRRRRAMRGRLAPHGSPPLRGSN